jgi:predicted nucleotidyltransferase
LILLKPLLYFSLFRYPLTEEEIFAFSEIKNKEAFKKELNTLVKDKIIYNINNFYLFENNDTIVKRRLIGNQNAKDIYSKANKVSQFISKFPFVEGVGISGSLSKGYYDEDSDIDFFIITSSKRLWIARTILVLYKKIFLLNSRKFFCINYYISTNSLEISEQNRFTATELATMIPMYGNGSFHDFYEHNKWAYNFLPNKNIAEGLTNLNTIKKPFFTKLTERLLSNKLGNTIDALFLKITYKRWKVKFKHLDQDHFNIAMKSTKNVSKHHPRNYQKQVIDRLNQKYLEYHKKHNIHLSKEYA